MSYSEKILMLRRKIGLTQSDFAKLISSDKDGSKVKRSSVSQWETGVKRPNPRHACRMIKLAKQFKISLSLEELLCDEEEAK